MKIRSTNLGDWDWINVITLLFDKTIKQSMFDKTMDGNETNELKKV